MPADQEIPPGLVDDLLARPTREEQTELLRSEGLLDAAGLDRLLDATDRLTGDDPGKAHRLAEVCADLAEAADAPVAVPRSAYIRVHTYNERGEFGSALHMVKLAHDKYAALGKNLEALRTNVGLMVTLLELGRYQEALDTGQLVLDALKGSGGYNVEPTGEMHDLLTAFVHQNRGRCLEYMGLYENAIDSYAIAEKRYRNLDMFERVGDINMNRGAVLLYLGRGSEGLRAQEMAASIYERASLTAMHAKALVNIGEAHSNLGNYARGLEAFERARHPLEALGGLADKYLLLRHTADAYLDLNLYAEALATYDEAISLLRNAGMAHDLGHALWGKGSALVAVSRLEEAREALSEAAGLFSAAGNLPQLSGVMLEQAALQAALGDGKAALATAERAMELVSGDRYPVHSVYARLRLADLLLSDDVAAAEPHLLAAGRLVDRLALPQLRYRLNERLGRLRRLQGRDEEALVLFETAIEEIERLRGAVSQETVRASFLRDKTSAYEELLSLYLERGDEESAWRAFTVAERARSRALVDLLAGVVESSPAFGDPELEARVRELQADLNATYSQMLGASMGGDGNGPFSDLRARADRLEREINRLRLRAAAAGDAVDLFEDTASPGEIGDRLPSDVTLVAYHVIGDEVMAFVNRGERLHVARHVGSMSNVQRLLQKLAVQWDRLNVNQDFAGRHAALLERSARQVLAALYSELVEPLEPLLEGANRISEGGAAVPKLAIVPHGPLHQAPFHALFDGEQYLIERFETSYAPSATVYALCQDREPHGSGNSLVLGVDDPSIPATIPEVRAVATHLPGAEIRVGEEATVAAFCESAPGRGVLHLATHGLFRSDNPMFSSLKLQDGWLMAHDVMGLDLDGALVTLSACESGRSEVIGGDETLGLTRAFLGAGAATLVVGLWVVQDETTATLMERWYAKLREGAYRSAALRAAQLEIKERHPHPYYWAPFVLVGKR